MTLEPVDLGWLAERSWATVETGGATLETRRTPTVLADQRLLKGVLENLFSNSVEHGSTGSRTQSDDAVEHGSAAVTITVAGLDSGFYVADDGAGIPADDRERVFERGFSTASDGTGFGLSIVSDIADSHGWTVRVTESDAGGARFEFSEVEFDGESDGEFDAESDSELEAN